MKDITYHNIMNQDERAEQTKTPIGDRLSSRPKRTAKTQQIEQALQTFETYLSCQGYRKSLTRMAIARVFLSDQHHRTVAELYQVATKQHSSVGMATVYRTLNLLVDAGLAFRRHFETGEISYEPEPDGHHDHLICNQCQKVVEFSHQALEALAQDIARSQRYQLTSYKVELYGLCGACRAKPIKRC